MKRFDGVLKRRSGLSEPAVRWRENLGSGVMAAVTSLPGTIVFGTVAFAPLGDDFVSKGIAASLTGAVILGGMVALVGASRLMVAGPRSYNAIILASVFTTLAPSGQLLQGGQGTFLVLIALGMVTAAAGGVFQVLLALFKVGRFVKYLPWPVMSGFINTTALMILLGQVRGILGIPRERSLGTLLGSLDEIRVMSVVIAFFTGCAVVAARRKFKRGPAPLAGLLAGTILFHTLGGAIPGFDAGSTLAVAGYGGFFLDDMIAVPGLLPENFLVAHWHTILSAGLSIAVLSSLSTLLCMAGIDGVAGQRSDPNRELLAHGAGNILSALFGGLPGAGKPGASLLAIRSGADSRVSGCITALIYLLILLVLAPLIGYIPVCVLSGMVVPIAVGFFDELAGRLMWSVIRLDIRQLRAGGSDYLTMSVVVGVGFLVNIMMAVAAGILFSILFFLVRSSRSLIRRELSGRSIRSRLQRTAREKRLLAGKGDRIHVLELEGTLFFGSAEGLLSRIEQRVEQGCKYVILDCKRMTDIDTTGAKVMVKLARSLKQREILLSLSHLDSHGHIYGTLLMEGFMDALGKGGVFGDTDHALRWCENRLLWSERPDPVSVSVPISCCLLTHGLTPEELARFRSVLVRCTFEAGEYLFKQGDSGHSLFLLERGHVEVVHKRSPEDPGIRLCTPLLGDIIGDLTLLDGRPRPAGAVSLIESTCFVLTPADFEQLSRRFPHIANTILANMVKILGERLRDATRVINGLEN
ncbi:MAG: SLC26A/SulP transporter family protein [Desulfobacteraceae bacterium]|nr:SLC26A/SulP transporter family protein [Desulfobacteraceae bacterium]